jgi:ADP-heptose:LPS heptosyltransferase
VAVSERVVLVLRALGLGDFLTGLPALRALRRAFPEDRLVLAAPAPLAPLLRLSATADELLPAEPLGPVAMRDPALAVNLHGRGPESHRVLLATRPGRLWAFANSAVAETAGMPPWRPDEHEAARWCRLLRELGVPADPIDLRLPRPAAAPPPAAIGATLIHPGAGSGSRRWPVERWVEVARAERAAGRPVAITAGPGELGLARQLAAKACLPEQSVLGNLDLELLAAAVAAAVRVACGDTGVAHLATALGRPSVVLFGPTDPALWGPPPGGLHRVLWTGTTGHPLAGEPDPGLLRIDAAQVIGALAALPEEVSARSTSIPRCRPRSSSR